MANVKGYITCPLCANLMGTLANYCNRCGAKLPPPDEPVDPVEKASRNADFADEDSDGICGDLGHDVQTVCGAKYCAACGAAFDVVNFSANPS